MSSFKHIACAGVAASTLQMVAQDPLGAASAKALLALAFGDRFKRVPWSVNDAKEGRALWQASAGVVGLKVWPVPASNVVNVQSVQGLLEVSLLDATGRMLGQWRPHSAVVAEISVRDLPAGLYVLRAQLATGMEQRTFTVMH